ncbi:hypothetical protein [Meiothermus sp. QL-1]|uniref:hypothetical protein n=1 Tax=Meiothermus sp. QL-1 TaxID=2058095 RepID=UPI0018F1C7F6|nr:hypothetical protein [Meiothermus sp. QL-1]
MLLVATFVLHIFFVTLALGTSGLSLFGFWWKKGNWPTLARLAARVTPNAVGLGIVTGIAPLLFIQVIYDPAWYTANTLTGFWSVAFIFVVMGGYSLAYLFYLKGSPEGRLLWAAAFSLALLFFAGWIMHVLASVSIYPEKWLQWYAPGGAVDTRGMHFHAYNLPRLTLLLPIQALLSLATVLMLLAWYFRKREDFDRSFLDWVASLGRRIALWVVPLFWLAGMGWAATQGRYFDLHGPMEIWFTLLALGLFLFYRSLRNPALQAPQALGVWLVALLNVGIMRELVRAASLERFGYRVAEYPWQLDWGGVTIFVLTTLVGVTVLAFLVGVLYASGSKKEGVEVSPALERLGSVAVGMLGAWFGFFLLLGVYTVIFLR